MRANGVSLLLLSLAFLAAALTGSGQLPTEPSPDVSCMPNQPREYMSQVLVSPNGQHQAFTHVLAQPVEHPTKSWECVDTADLYVRSVGDRDFRIVHRDKGDLVFGARGILPVDWSPDSRYLLLFAYHGEYYTDNVGYLILLYDVHEKRTLNLDYLEAMGRFYGKTCMDGFVEVLGFTPKGEVVFEISESPLDGVPIGNSCPESRFGVWALDHKRLTARPFPSEHPVRRYAKIQRTRPRIN